MAHVRAELRVVVLHGAHGAPVAATISVGSVGLSGDIGDAHFKPFVDEGRILKFSHIDPETSIEERRYCLPTEEWRCKLSQLMSRMCRTGEAFDVFTTNDLARLEGALLGYPEESIEAFIAHAASSKILTFRTD